MLTACLNDRIDMPPTKVMTARPILQHFQQEAEVIIIKVLDEDIITRVSQLTTCSLIGIIGIPQHFFCLEASWRTFPVD